MKPSGLSIFFVVSKYELNLSNGYKENSGFLSFSTFQKILL